MDKVNHISKVHTNVSSIMLVNHIYINYFILGMNLDIYYPIYYKSWIIVFFSDAILENPYA